MRIALVLLVSLLHASAAAQAVTAAAARERQAAATAGTPAWFEHGFEVVEAELWYDIASAVRTAAALVDRARAAPAADELLVADAMHRYAVAVRDGPALVPAAALPTDDEPRAVANPAQAMSPSLAARLHTARARFAWVADLPNEFLPSILRGLESARASGSAALRARAAWALHRVVETEAPTYDAELLRELDSLRDQPGFSAFVPWQRLNLYWLSSAEHTREERLDALAEIVAAANSIGDLRTRVYAEWDRAEIEMAVDTTMAEPVWQSALADCERLGSRWMVAVSLEQLADCALAGDRPDTAAEWLRKAAEVTVGRGLPDREVAQAHRRLRIASRRGDTAAVAAETSLLDGLRKDEVRRYRGYPTLREQLLSGERQRMDLERGLAAERGQAAARVASTRTFAMVGAIVALAVVAVVALVGRRRLLRQVERTEAEAATRRALEQRMQRLERADSLGVFASGIAHDFNNLMVGVVGNAELLQRDERDPERRRWLAALAAAGERGTRLCRQLQAHVNALPTPPVEFDLAEVVRAELPVLEASSRDQCRVTLEVGEGPFRLVGSATEIGQVLLNLVTNARDAMARTVVIRLARVVLADGDWPTVHVFGEPRPGAFVRLDVVDDGEGMRADQIDRIFDPFFTTRFPGRGLGLAGVQAIVRHHRGAIVVESHPGRGSRFRVHLPAGSGATTAAVGDVPPSEPAASIPVAAPGMTVVVVDDEPHVRQYIEIAMQQRGHHAVCVADGADLSSLPPQIGDGRHCAALVDLTMPGADGRDVVRRLRHDAPNIAVVLMSGHDDEHLAATARQIGAEGWIGKPFTGDVLERTLATAVRLRRSAAEPSHG